MYQDSQRQSWKPSANCRRGALLVALASLVSTTTVLRAEDVYKSVDAEGHVVYSDRAGSPNAQQYVVRLDDAENPPPVLHFCWTNCFTLSLDHRLYRRTDGSDETWTVERFTSKSVTLRRHDAPASWNGSSADVIYEGQVSNDRLFNVTVNGKAVPDVKMAWGAALDVLPGSNAERDQRNSSQPRAPVPSVSPPPSTANIEPAADFEIRAAAAPPPLPNDEQPPAAEEGDLWTPGYWAWGGAEYYWVRGAWVRPPRMGVLWTPGYWGFAGAVYVFHPGYWGPHVGFYGGINYGFGYGGNNVANKVSYNGGPGGTTAVASAQERAAEDEVHIPATPMQRQAMQQAANHPAHVMRASGIHQAVDVTRRSAAMKPRVVAAYGTAPPSAHLSEAPSVASGSQSDRAAMQSTNAGQPAATMPTATKATKHMQGHAKQ